MRGWADGPRLFEHLTTLPGPLRFEDVPGHLQRHRFGKVLVYGYATGVFSSRKLATRLVEDIAFRMLAAGNFPQHRTLCSSAGGILVISGRCSPRPETVRSAQMDGGGSAQAGCRR